MTITVSIIISKQIFVKNYNYCTKIAIAMIVQIQGPMQLLQNLNFLFESQPIWFTQLAYLCGIPSTLGPSKPVWAITSSPCEKKCS